MSDELLKKVVREFYKEDGFKKCSVVVLHLQKALNQASLAKDSLNKIANDLDEWHFNTSVVKVVGGSTGVGGVIVGVLAR